MKGYDVVIIGAGLAGLQCARLLARHGAKILLVDRKADLTAGVHTTGIFVRRTFEDFDFPEGALGRPIRNVTLFSPKLRSLDLESAKAEFRVGKMGAIYQSFLGECLDRGVDFSGGTRYLTAEVGSVDGETIVRLEKNGRKFDVKTKVLIGADGARSRVAGDLQLDRNSEWIVGYEEVYRDDDAHREPRLYCFLDADLAPGYLAWIAADGEEVHIGVGGYSSVFNPREALKQFKQKTMGKIFDLKMAVPKEARGGLIPVGGILGRIANKNGLLIGDAAGAVSPLTAGGLDPALRLSCFAAEIVRKRLQTGDPDVLLGYSGALFRARFVSRLWMRRIIKTLTNQSFLELGCAILRGRIGQKFARHVFFGRGSFPDVETRELEGQIEVI